jgi:hypothetical protein
MPYDPNYPPQNAKLQSAPMRAQFNSLKTLIDNVPVPMMALAGSGAFSQVLDASKPVVFIVDTGAGSSLLFHDDGTVDGVWKIVNDSANDVNVAAASGAGSIGMVAANTQARLVVTGGVGTLS